jgi:flavin-dependent thymidylate synthase
MKVELISYTPNALELLLYTKNTRLQGAQSLQDIIDWPMEKKLEHLAYMKDTIQSSWEFCEYVFEINGVTRAFTHQLVRTRTGSYAQESQRTVDVRESEVVNTSGDEFFDVVAEDILEKYGEMIDNGIQVQDARGILPTNVATSIIAKFDLRTIHNTAMTRLCTRTQGEYQKVFKDMVAEIVKVHPWANEFIKVHCAWYGVCAFPRYTECPVQEHTVIGKRLDDMKVVIEQVWERTNHVANPIAKGGVTQ